MPILSVAGTCWHCFDMQLPNGSSRRCMMGSLQQPLCRHVKLLMAYHPTVQIRNPTRRKSTTTADDTVTKVCQRLLLNLQNTGNM